tara:strand:- start:222 stop:452 length:231 start_codon:yes stop_codon:yes gene_type:complete
VRIVEKKKNSVFIYALNVERIVRKQKMNTSKETVEYIIKFNKSLYDKLSKNGIEDSDYPFAKRIVVEKVDIGSKKE